MNPKSKSREKTKGRFFVNNIIGTSPRIQEVIRLVEKIADSPLSVLITGESGNLLVLTPWMPDKPIRARQSVEYA